MEAYPSELSFFNGKGINRIVCGDYHCFAMKEVEGVVEGIWGFGKNNSNQINSSQDKIVLQPHQIVLPSLNFKIKKMFTKVLFPFCIKT